jgi:ribonucleoside-diphosphate reductase alpha chain
MPRVRNSKTFSFVVGGLHGYFTVGEFEDGTPGELFVTAAKMGSTLGGLMDSFARSISYGLQYGVPLKAYVKGMSGSSFAPSGATDDPEVKTATSIVDYIFKRLAVTYLSLDDRLELGLASMEDLEKELESQQQSLLEEAEAKVDEKIDLASTTVGDFLQSKPAEATQPKAAENEKVAEPEKPPMSAMNAGDAPMCSSCGNMTQRAGSCYVCTTCGTTSGCS